MGDLYIGLKFKEETGNYWCQMTYPGNCLTTRTLGKDLKGNFEELDEFLEKIQEEHKGLNYEIKNDCYLPFGRKTKKEELQQLKKNLETRFPKIKFKLTSS